MANALAVNVIQRDGRLPHHLLGELPPSPTARMTMAWNQGLLFLNPSKVWLQPPGYVTKMYSVSYQPVEVRSIVSDSNSLDVSSQFSQNGKTLVLKVVNLGEKVIAPASIRLHGYSPAHAAAC